MYWQEDFWHFCDTKIVSAICGRYMWLPRQINNRGLKTLSGGWTLQHTRQSPHCLGLYVELNFCCPSDARVCYRTTPECIVLLLVALGHKRRPDPQFYRSSAHRSAILIIDIANLSVPPSVCLSVCLPILSFTFRVFVETTRHCHGFSTAR